MEVTVVAVAIVIVIVVVDDDRDDVDVAATCDIASWCAVSVLSCELFLLL
jgi:hypothetical protein